MDPQSPKTHEDIMFKLGEMHADIRSLKGVEPRVRSLEVSRGRLRGVVAVMTAGGALVSAELLDLWRLL